MTTNSDSTNSNRANGNPVNHNPTNHKHSKRITEIRKVINDLAIANGSITYQSVIDTLETMFAEECDSIESFEKAKSCFIRDIKNVADSVQVSMVNSTPSWKTVQAKVKDRAILTSEKESDISIISTNSRQKLSPLKAVLDEHEKVKFQNSFERLDKKFWVLKATEEQFEKEEMHAGDISSVEEKIYQFGMECKFKHPCHSFVVDVDDISYEGIFTTEELDEIENSGNPLLLPINDDIAGKIKELSRLKTARQAYYFAASQLINYDPEKDAMMVWFLTTLLETSLQFLKRNNHQISSLMESDKQYYLWGFMNKIFNTTNDIWAVGKENSSSANSTASNNKGKLSSIDEICHEAMGRKMDIVFIGGTIKLGCMDIGAKTGDQTKEMQDGSLKMPLVMKDMLVAIVNEAPSLLHNVGITGVCINGEKICMVDVDCPKGYITRVRRTASLFFPTSQDDYVIRIIPLLELSITIKMKMERTFELYKNTPMQLQKPTRRRSVLPPSFDYNPSISKQKSSSTSLSTSTASNQSDSSNKRQKLAENDSD